MPPKKAASAKYTKKDMEADFHFVQSCMRRGWKPNRECDDILKKIEAQDETSSQWLRYLRQKLDAMIASGELKFGGSAASQRLDAATQRVVGMHLKQIQKYVSQPGVVLTPTQRACYTKYVGSKSFDDLAALYTSIEPGLKKTGIYWEDPNYNSAEDSDFEPGTDVEEDESDTSDEDESLDMEDD